MIESLDLWVDSRAALVRTRLAALAEAVDELLNWPAWADPLASRYARLAEMAAQPSDSIRLALWHSLSALARDVRARGQQRAGLGRWDAAGQLILLDGQHRAAIALALGRPYLVELAGGGGASEADRVPTF